MKNLFERTSSTWVRYSEYEWKKSEDGILYLTPSKTAQPSIYDPLTEYQQIVLDAINIGRMGMSKKPDEEIQKTIQQFAVKYDLFGLMTALPTTPNFMDRQTDGGQYELSERICRTIRLDEATVYRLGI